MSVAELPPVVDASATDAETHVCAACGRSFANRFSLSAHKRHCKGAGEKAKSAASDAAGDGSAKGAGDGSGTAATRRERKPHIPTRPTKRHDCSGLLGPMWGQLARFVPSVPAQRAMVWQSPGAGRVLDNALAGTIVDRWALQKLAGAESKYRPAIDLVSLPLMLVMVEKQPAMLAVLQPLLVTSIKANLEAALDAAAADKAEDDRLRAKAEAAGMEWDSEEVDPETGKLGKVSLVEAILRDLLAPAGTGYEASSEDTNGQVA